MSMLRSRTAMSLFSLALLLCSPKAHGATPPSVTCEYTLPTDGKVSLAIYDGAGRQIRTLLNAEPQTAGRHTLAWDGLDRDGRPAPAGEYHWRLACGPGIRAEYLLSLGTSVGIHHWIGQHGGPNAVAVDDDGIIAAGHPEGAPLLCKVNFDGTYRWPASQIEPAQGAADLVAHGKRVLMLHTNGFLYNYDGATGKRDPQRIPLWLPARPLGEVPLTDAREQKVEFAVPNGTYLLRATVGDDQEFSVPLWVTMVDRQGELGSADAGKRTTQTIPEVFRHPSTFTVKKSKLPINFKPKIPGKWRVESMGVIAIPTRIAARDGAVAVVYPGADLVAWIDPVTGKILDQVPMPIMEELREQDPTATLLDLDLLDADTALVLAGKQVYQVSRKTREVKRVTEPLAAPACIAVDASRQSFLIVEHGKSHQIERYDLAGALKATYGRAGGRQAGLYRPENFLAVEDIASDAHGGFVIVEAMSAPRRTAHFDRDGKLLKEWYGGQQFYTAAVPDPVDPKLVWMDSQWGWVMQVEVDYDRRQHTVRACYPWAAGLDPFWLSTNKMTRHMVPMRADLDDDGKSETYLWSDSHSGLLLKVDEVAGKLQPVAAMGRNEGGRDGAESLPVEKLSPVWVEALEAISPGLSKRPERKGYSLFTWADANGDYRMQAAEIRLTPPGVHALNAGIGCSWLDDALRIWSAKPDEKNLAYVARAPVGRTATGSPIWDWSSPTTNGPTTNFRGSRALRVDGRQGDIYELLSGGGDGFAAGLDSEHSHGFGWPSTLTDRTGFAKFNKAGELEWQVGLHAARIGGLRGTTHFPVGVAGFAHGCVGIADYAAVPCHFWTTDGLFVGQLLDARADDGLPARAYAWWRANTSRGDEFDNLAFFQYDLLVGGALFQRDSGEALFMGAGWNNVPVYRVHGLDKLERQTGTVTLMRETKPAQAVGTGLQGESFDAEEQLLAVNDPADAKKRAEEKELEDLLDSPNKKKPSPLDEAAPARPVGTRVDKQIWFEAAEARHAWPGGPPKAARWVGQLEPRFSEPYTLVVYTNGGSRLWVDGKLVLDAWDKGGKQFAKPVVLKAGQRVPIKVEWKRLEKAPEMHLSWESPSQGIEHIPQAHLYPPGPAR